MFTSEMYKIEKMIHSYKKSGIIDVQELADLQYRHLRAGDRGVFDPAIHDRQQDHHPLPEGPAGAHLLLDRDGGVPEPGDRHFGRTVPGPCRVHERRRVHRRGGQRSADARV